MAAGKGDRLSVRPRGNLVDVLRHRPGRREVAEPGTSILPLKDMLDLYLSTSQITQTYLSWYATVALAIAGYIATNRDTITTRTKGMIAFVFFFSALEICWR
jgi:hypothetical protein